jgi:hypothetical protein
LFVRHVWWLMNLRPAQGCRTGRDSTVELCGGDRTRCIGHPAPADGTATDPPQLESGGVASGIFRNGSPRRPLLRVLCAGRNHRAYRVVVRIVARGLFVGPSVYATPGVVSSLRRGAGTLIADTDSR